MEEEFGFKLSDDDLQELKELSELGERLFEEGYAEGKAKAMKILKFIKSQLIAGSSLDEALVLAGVSKEEYAEYKDLFSGFPPVQPCCSHCVLTVQYF